MRAANGVGRVGGLAIAFGVGTAIVGLCGAAAADSSSAGSSRDSSAREGSARSAAVESSAASTAGPRKKAVSRLPRAAMAVTAPVRDVSLKPAPVDAAETPRTRVPAVPAEDAGLALAGVARRDEGIFGNSIITDPDVEWVDGVLRGTLGATSTNGLALTYSVVNRPNLGGKITFAALNPEGQFSYLPYISTVTDPSVDEQFSIMASEVSALNTFLSNVPVVGLLVPSVFEFLQQVPLVSQLLAPLIGRSQIVDFSENALQLSGAKPVAFTYRMPSFDGTPISINYFPAVNVSQGLVSSAPLILNGAGLGIPGNTDPDSIWEKDDVPGIPAIVPGLEPLRTDSTPGGYDGGGGYNVITWDSRGKFDSGGFLQMNSPFWEGRDATAIISWAVSNSNPAANQIAMEAAGDPLLGMIGGSYGGGIQLVTAGTPDRRIDAIAPWIAWNSLTDALYPSNTFKSAWSSVLLLDLLAAGARVNSQIYSGLLLGDLLGFLTPSSVALLADSGPTILVNNIDIPTLFIQGTVDTLFPLDQALTNAQQIVTANPGVPVKMSWFCGGHGVCDDPWEADQDERNLADNLRWMDQYVSGSGTSADSIPDFQWVDQAGHYYTSDLLPFEAGFNNDTPLSYQGAGGRLGIVPIAGGSGPSTIIPEFPQAVLAFTGGSRARNALNLSVAPPVGTQVAGAPTLSFTYSGVGTSRAVFAQLVDDATGRVVGNIVTPVPVTLDGREHTVEIPMENIAYTVYQASDSMTLQITSSATAFENWTAFGLIDISNIQLDMPTVAE